MKDNLIGYPSKDKPWMKYYDEETLEVPSCTVFQRIFENNRMDSQNIALEYFGSKISYKQLFEEINKVASAFVNYGVKKNDIVIIFSSSTPEIIIAVLALGRIGAIANMLSPLFTEEQIIAHINETDAQLMIVMEQLWTKVSNIVEQLCVNKITVVSAVSSMPNYLKCFVSHKLREKIQYTEKIVKWKEFITRYHGLPVAETDVYEKEQPFIMVYSSGTTGASKGIVLTNDGINALISHYQSPDFPYMKKDKFLQIVPISFSTGIVLSCIMPLCLGVTVILEPVFSIETFCRDVWKYRPSMVLGATSLWLALIKNKKFQKTDLSFLKYPISGGEQMLPRIELQINAFLKERNCCSEILQGWGMCELGGTVCTNTRKHKKLGGTGIPIKGVVVAAFDTVSNQEQSYNQRGELRVLSPAKMKGYFKNEVATKKFFHEDAKGRIWGCTGDIGYVDKDGDVFVLGRASDFFISSGRKIYCFDVEAVVYQSDNVARCKVVTLMSQQEKYELTVHLVKEDTYSGADEELIKEVDLLCKSHLTEEESPWGYRIWESLPVKPTGKVDIEKLGQVKDGFLRVMDGEICYENII